METAGITLPQVDNCCWTRPIHTIKIRRFHNGGNLGVKAMPMNMTLKNIPDELYELLKANAQLNRRSLNSEAIMCLETTLKKPKIPASERIARAKALYADLNPKKFKAADIDRFKREGRA
jgi:antitoxin FitA